MFSYVFSGKRVIEGGLGTCFVHQKGSGRKLQILGWPRLWEVWLSCSRIEEADLRWEGVCDISLTFSIPLL